MSSDDQPNQTTDWHPIEQIPENEVVLMAAKPSNALFWRFGVGLIDDNGIIWDWPFSFPATHFQAITEPKP